MLARFRFWLVIAAVSYCFHTVYAQQAPLTEMRGCWIATLNNIDWPSRAGLPPERQRMEFDSLLDALKATGINAVFVQIRPAGDALYPTPSAPWSRFLSGQEGIPPLPPYDPVEYMVEAAHKRQMAFHAWLNPFRATPDLDTAALAPTHPLKMLPPNRVSDWFFQYANRYYFNPGSPFVKQYLVSLVHDLVARYDIDGIHFDDYFYPYKEPGWEINDFNAFAADPRGFQYIDDWRRDNVNRVVEAVSKEIKLLKPYVQFGVSPVGVWRNRDRDPNGSNTNSGMTAYDDLYADVLHWLKQGWIDYAAPQLYWSIGFPAADYTQLSDWWARHNESKPIYIGHAAYKIGNASAGDPAWNDPGQISRQIALNRMTPALKGSIFFSSNTLLKNPLGVRDSLARRWYQQPAIAPAASGSPLVAPATPNICRVEGNQESIKLAWQVCNISAGGEMPYFYSIHRFPGSGVGDINDSHSLLAITDFNSGNWIFEDKNVSPKEIYTYVVVGYNRANLPGYPSSPVVVKKTKKKAKKMK